MKNIKYSLFITLVSVFALGVLGITNIVSAAPAYPANLNTDPQDSPMVMAANYTLYPDSSGHWVTNLSGVQAGQDVAILIYYHNGGPETARNLVARLSNPTGQSTSFSITGIVDADNSSAASGVVAINLSSSQTLTFVPGSVRWYPNNCSSYSCAQNLPFGQNGSELFGSGLRLGDIPAGWPTQGNVVVHFRVSNNQPPAAPTVTISANPGTVNYGGSSTLNWSSTNATSCFASGGWSGTKAVNGSESTGALYNSTTFTITCSNSAGQQASASATVTVQQQQPQYPTVDLSANPTNVNYGNSSTLSWSSTNAVSCYASGDWSGSKSINSSESTGALYSTRNYTLTCTSSTGQSASDSVSVTVQQQQPQYPTVDIYASPSSVNYGNSTTLYWSSNNAASCYASGDWSGTKSTNSSEGTGALYSNRTYTITCTSSTGQQASDSITVPVNQQQQVPTVSIYASPSTVDYGNSSILYWNSSNANSCYASGGWSGTKSTSGSENTGSLYNSTTYTVTCSNSSGSNSASATVFVNQQQQQLPVVTTQCYATNVGDTTATLNASVSANNNISGTTVWFEYGRNSVTDLQSSSQIIYGNTAVSRSVSNLSPNSTYFCRAVAQNNAGRVNGQINSFTTGGAVVQAPFVTTNPATGVGANSATLNGQVTTNSLSNTTTWFEYGTTLNLGLQTTAVSLGSVSASSFSRFVSSLNSGTTYYFRAVAQNGNGVGRGAILSFVTGQVLGVQTGINRVSISKEVANLSFPNGTKTAIAGWAGNTLEYGITIRNTGDTTLSGLTITDTLSPFVAFKSASDGGTNSAGAVTWSNITLSPGESKRVAVQVTAGKFNDNVVAENVARVSNSAVSRTSNNTIAIINLYPLTLSIVPDKDLLNSGDDVTYTISYKNEGKSNLTDAVLRVILPTGEEYVSSSGTFSQDNNTVSFQIGNIAQEGAGTITVRAKVKDNVTEGDKLTAVAVMSFKDAFSQAQIEVKAYAQNTVGEAGAVLGTSASIFGAGFFPSTLVGWLLLILLLVLLALFIRRMFDYRRPATTTSTTSTTTTPSNP